MELTKHEQLFLRILRAALGNGQIDPAQVPEGIDWNALMQLASRHKVLPMVVSGVPRAYLPYIQMYKQAVIRQVVEQTMKSSGFLNLYGAMRRAGFHPLVVKGIVCRGMYPQGDFRPSGDEDLFVPDREFGPCCQFLRDYGMVPVDDISADSYEVAWQKPGGHLYIELHRRLFSPDSRAYGDLENLFDGAAERAAAYPTGFGGEVYSLSPHDHMLYLLLHAYKHFLHSGVGIRQVCDIGLWARKYRDQIDWDRLEAQCGACSAMQYAAAILGIAVYDLEIPLELPQRWRTERAFCQPLLDDILTGGIYGTADSDRQHSSTMTLNAVEADRFGGRRNVWKSVFLSRADMERKYPWLKKYPVGLPFAWVHRIFRYLKQNRAAGSSLSSSITIGNERVKLLQMYGIIK